MFCSFLSEKTVVLVTHQLQFIKNVDKIVIMEKGKILAEGDYDTVNVRKAQRVGTRLFMDEYKKVLRYHP